VKKPARKRQLGNPRRRWEDNIKMDLQEVVWGGGMNWIDRTQDRDKWRAVVSEVMNLFISLNAGNMLTCYVSISFSGRTLMLTSYVSISFSGRTLMLTSYVFISFSGRTLMLTSYVSISFSGRIPC